MRVVEVALVIRGFKKRGSTSSRPNRRCQRD